MDFIENLSCEYEECHFNHDRYCFNESVTLDIGASCENVLACDDFDCNDCEFFEFCTKEKKYTSTAFSADESLFPKDE